MVVNVRSAFSAGVAASLLAAGAGTAVGSPALTAPLPVMAAPTVQLSALMSALPKPTAAARPTKPSTGPFSGGVVGSISDWIINSYNTVQPWIQYSVDLGAWGVSWMPFPINYAAPQMTIGYSGIEPLAQAGVYSFAYALGGQWELIGPTVKNGVDTAYGNFVRGQIGWITSFFPPAPPLGGASMAAPKAVAPAAASIPAAPAARSAPAKPTATATASAPGVKPAAPAQTVVPPPLSSADADASPSVPAPSALTSAPAAPRRSAARVQRSTPAPAAAVTAPVGADTGAGVSAPKAAAAAAATSSTPRTRAHQGTRAGAKGSPGAAGSAKASRAGR